MENKERQKAVNEKEDIGECKTYRSLINCLYFSNAL